MRWRILALLFTARVSLGFQFQTMSAVGDDLSGAIGLDNAQIGFMIGLFMAPGIFFALPAGFSGRFASDRVLAGLGLVALALGGAMSSVAAGPGAIGLGRVQRRLCRLPELWPEHVGGAGDEHAERRLGD